MKREGGDEKKNSRNAKCISLMYGMILEQMIKEPAHKKT